MKYTTTSILFVDHTTSEDAAVGVRYGHPGGAGVVLYLEQHWDIEAAMTLEQARELLGALRTAVEWDSQGRLSEITEPATIACMDMDTKGEGRATVRYDDASVTVGLAIESEANMELSEVTMGRKEAEALVFALEAAVKWVSLYGTPG